MNRIILMIFSSLLLVLVGLSLAQSKKTVLDYWKALSLEPEQQTDVVDLKNDYIAFSAKTSEGGGELAVWRKKSGGDLIGLTTRGCGPVCVVGSLRFSEPKGGKFVDMTSKVLPGIISKDGDVKLNASIEKQLLVKYNSKSDEKISSAKELLYYFLLPRKGTTIQICYGTGDCEIELGRYVWRGSSFEFAK